MTPQVNAQKGFMPKVNISAKRVERPMQRKQSTKAHDLRFLIGEMTFGLNTLSNQFELAATWLKALV